MSYQYDADYFLRGKQTGKSLYEDYRWIPDLTVPMARRIVEYLGIDGVGTGNYSLGTDVVLDFGCARGYLVKALRQLGHNAYGVDVSEWAVENCDPEVKMYVGQTNAAAYSLPFVDWIITKDVLEHVTSIFDTIDILTSRTRKGVFAVVPLANTPSEEGGLSYDVPEYEQDVTHIWRQELWWWVSLFMRPGWSVEARYRIPGIKDNYAEYPTGNGFITARRLPQ